MWHLDAVYHIASLNFFDAVYWMEHADRFSGSRIRREQRKEASIVCNVKMNLIKMTLKIARLFYARFASSADRKNAPFAFERKKSF